MDKVCQGCCSRWAGDEKKEGGSLQAIWKAYTLSELQEDYETIYWMSLGRDKGREKSNKTRSGLMVEPVVHQLMKKGD